VIVYLLYITWDGTAYDTAIYAADATIAEIKKTVAKTGTDNPYIYLITQVRTKV